MELTKEGIDLIVSFEGLRLKAYQHKGDKPTIGIGSTYYKDGTPVKLGDKITKEQAYELFHDRLNKEYMPQLNGALKVKLTPNQYSALLSLLYNCGIGNLRKSQLLGIVNQDPNDARIPLIWHNTYIRKGSQFEVGLRRRREAEAKLYST